MHAHLRSPYIRQRFRLTIMIDFMFFESNCVLLTLFKSAFYWGDERALFVKNNTSNNAAYTRVSYTLLAPYAYTYYRKGIGLIEKKKKREE